MRNLRFGYGDGCGDWQVACDLAVPRGASAALLGPSGAGKSTLLALAAGFETPHSGAVLVDGRDISARPPAQRPITTLFQEHNLFGHLDAFRNTALGIDPGLRIDAAQRRDVAAALDRVGLAGKHDRLPGALSGGERQRVAIARALVMRRPLLLLDEPFAALGPALRRDMLNLVDALRRETGMTVLMVSHEPADARRVADLTAFVHGGGIALCGPTDAVLNDPADPDMRAYLGLDPVEA
ncbi:MAG: ATP-binding cassette domain-containing protein [Rhodospirillales bacterium]|nr:ATP-binding cassette domain-containing protein [Rhodospirillales bacterium]